MQYVVYWFVPKSRHRHQVFGPASRAECEKFIEQAEAENYIRQITRWSGARWRIEAI